MRRAGRETGEKQKVGEAIKDKKTKKSDEQVTTLVFLCPVHDPSPSFFGTFNFTQMKPWPFSCIHPPVRVTEVYTLVNKGHMAHLNYFGEHLGGWKLVKVGDVSKSDSIGKS